VSKARSYKSKLAEARVDTELNAKGKTVFVPNVSMLIEVEEDLPTEAQFRKELIRLQKWIDQTLIWLDKYHK
jgi:hypothetical protein